MNLLVFNAGSATLKFAVFEDAPPRCRMRGQVEPLGGATQLLLSVRGETRSRRIKADNHAAAADAILTELMPQETAFDDRALVVGHRLVHGGARFNAPLRLDAERLDELDALAPRAPLHLPPALAVIRLVAATLGTETSQVAVFDTAYFHDLPPAARDDALPREWVERFGLRRYGFHALAHQSLYAQFCGITRADPARVKVINFQLGHGCSAAAIEGGRAVDTSMSFTPLDGLVMGTRPGRVDPGLIRRRCRRTRAVDPGTHLRRSRMGRTAPGCGCERRSTAVGPHFRRRFGDRLPRAHGRRRIRDRARMPARTCQICRSRPTGISRGDHLCKPFLI